MTHECGQWVKLGDVSRRLQKAIRCPAGLHCGSPPAFRPLQFCYTRPPPFSDPFTRILSLPCSLLFGLFRQCTCISCHHCNTVKYYDSPTTLFRCRHSTAQRLSTLLCLFLVLIASQRTCFIQPGMQTGLERIHDTHCAHFCDSTLRSCRQ